MSDIPSSWKRSTIGEVSAYIQRGKSPKYIDQSDLPVINQKCIRWDEFQLQHLKYIHPEQFSAWDQSRFIKASDILWNSTGTGTVGRAYHVKEADCTPPKVVDSHVTIVRAAPEIDSRYLFNWIKGPDVQGKLEEMCDGTTNQIELSKTAIAATAIPIAPREEQTRIANQLDTLLTRIQSCNDRLDAIPALLKRFRRVVLTSAISGRLTADWREQATAPNQKTGAQVVNDIRKEKLEWIKTNPLHNEIGRIAKRLENVDKERTPNSALPIDWTQASLEDVVLMVVDCHNKTAPYSRDGIPLIRTTNVRDGKFVFEDLRYVTTATFQHWAKRCVPKPGDLIFTREAPMGEVAIIPEGHSFCLGQRTMLLRPVEKYVSAQYLKFALMEPKFRQQSESMAVGSGVKHFRVGDVSEFQLPVPPLLEQAEIVRRVEALFALADRIEARATAARAHAQRLSPLVLAKAFRGELVPQDPQDEPASALLTRIAAERSTSAPLKASRGRKSKGSIHA